MPRNGQGVYSKPAGTTAVPNTTIESSKFNTVVDDLVQDANAARPVTAGGTGSATPEGARSGLSVPGLSDVNAFTKTQKLARGEEVASAAALTLGDDGNYFDITGTTAITSIATKGAGTVVKLHFDAALTITHHATDLVLPGGVNITTAAGDEVEFVEYETGKWRCTCATLASSREHAGEVSFFARSTPPPGWLKANGAAVSRSTYAALFAAIGTTFGTGDGSTTFNLPDARGEFFRGWDDGRGIDSGRALGTSQGFLTRADYGRYNSLATVTAAELGATTRVSASHSSFDVQGSLSGNSFGTETRPRNIALLGCIKY